jgi:hypothetical protein
MPTLLDAALRYTEAGLAVIPCARATKRPRLRRWKPYQSRPPTPDQVRRWFASPARADALAIVTGSVSGGLEVLDVDAPRLLGPWARAVHIRQADLLDQLVVVRTQSGGFHVYYRCPALTAGNQKLAVDPARPGGHYTLIETRGAGGYALAPPSPGYTLLQGDPGVLPELTPDARALLLAAARQFSRATPTPPPPPQPRARCAHLDHGARPGDDYNRRGDVPTLLEHHGWRRVRQVRATSYWRRPGKRRGHSATFNYHATRYFYVFSTNAPPFEPERGYSPFAVFALLEHGGDYRHAAAALRKLGYGRAW